MINEFFCWLTGHESFSGAKGEKLYKRDGRRFVYSGIKIYPCKCCNILFTKWDKEIPEVRQRLFLPEIEDKDIPPMPGRSGLTG